ncbi:MAG: serine protein kinase RIO [Candidatus Woesearchaeota archaeon]
MVINRSREAWKTYGNVFDNFTLRNIERLASQGYFEEITTALALGKEANIFVATTKDGSKVVLKIYRLENCNFNKMYEYISQDARYNNLKGQKRRIIFSWTQREYRNILKARDHIRVPAPLVFKNNIVVMEYIDEFTAPAPKLKDVAFKDPQSIFQTIIDMVYSLVLDAGLVHGDLSEFNILLQGDQPVFIDFSQGTSTDSPNAPELLRRDLNVLCHFFKKRGVHKDPEKLYDDIISQKKQREKQQE